MLPLFETSDERQLEEARAQLVKVLTTQAKTKTRGTRRGRVSGRTSPWRKAVVTLAAGQKIQFFEGV